MTRYFTEEHKKYIANNMSRLSKEEKLNFIKTFIIRRGYKNLLSQDIDGPNINLSTIDDPELIKLMYVYVSDICSKYDE